MKKFNWFAVAGCVAVLVMLASVASAAYQHAGDADKDAKYFRDIYPDKVGTKLDNCTLCHSGGVDTSGKKPVAMGSCQWCHFKYGYNQKGDIKATLNAYGMDYLTKGRNPAALKAIEAMDSDKDGFTNIAEIQAIRYPGDQTDDPAKAIAPYRVFSKAQLQAMPQHPQFLLMNTTKSGDYYAEYSGVIMQDLLKKAGMTANATKLTVYAPDGFAQGHPLEDSASNVGSSYAPFVNGTYPAATYYYDVEANTATTSYGWCDYTSPGNAGRKHGDAIAVADSLRLILALKADGKDLVPGVLDSTNKLKSGTEGPFRVIAPQKLVGPPDQASTATKQDVKWPYDANADHNAGFCSKSATIIKVEPLPAGTTDIDVLEAGWSYIDQGKIIIYGALDQLTLVSPADGAKNVPWKGVPLIWNRVTDPADPAAPITYTVEYTKENPNLGHWTRISAASAAAQPLYAGAGMVVLLGTIAMMAMGGSRRSKRLLGVVIILAIVGATFVSCGGGDNDPGSRASQTVTLEATTQYYWRVTADGPSFHNVSEVSSFTTEP
jgi:hypothetical protein